jgi:hypothetical protein
MTSYTPIRIVMPVVSYLIDNWRQVFEVVIAAHAVALMVVNLTPTPKDDRAVGAIGAALPKLYRALEILAGIVLPMAKR